MSNRTLYFLCLIMITNLSCSKISDKDVRNVVINEIMPVNHTSVPDENGLYKDWVELYNMSPEAIDISGCYLSDKKSNTPKWKIPSTTIIEGNGFIIIWADEDTTLGGLHANFKLSASGETLVFTQRNHSLIDEVAYPAQTLEQTYSRNPDGNGRFKWQNPTFDRSNIYAR